MVPKFKDDSIDEISLPDPSSPMRSVSVYPEIDSFVSIIGIKNDANNYVEIEVIKNVTSKYPWPFNITFSLCFHYEGYQNLQNLCDHKTEHQFILTSLKSCLADLDMSLDYAKVASATVKPYQCFLKDPVA